MVSDSIINASIPNASKDLSKKKRANRSAKLKQCKLDARREQWLSQVKNKNCNGGGVSGGVGGGGGGGGQFNGVAIETGKKSGGLCKGLEVESQRVEVISSQNDSDSETSPGNSPMSSVSRGTDVGNAYIGCSSSSCSFSFSSGGCCSGSITEEEEGEGGGGGDGDGDGDDDGCLDDWEAVADALVGASDGNQVHHNVNGDDDHDHDQALERETTVGSSSEVRLPSSDNVDSQMEKLKTDVGILGKGTTNCRAWRPDDAFRPQSLPNLAKQRSFPSGVQRHHTFVNPWVRNITPRVPTSCPICCEDLDLTDSSFLPCPCGFHLCLFCHKRIIEEDGRCPGCRKPYTSEPVEETTVSSAQGGLTFRLSRSCSMSCSRA